MSANMMIVDIAPPPPPSPPEGGAMRSVKSMCIYGIVVIGAENTVGGGIIR